MGALELGREFHRLCFAFEYSEVGESLFTVPVFIGVRTPASARRSFPLCFDWPTLCRSRSELAFNDLSQTHQPSAQRLDLGNNVFRQRPFDGPIFQMNPSRT